MEKNYGIITQGNIIRKNRIAKMWSQKQLAEEIGVKQNTITFWENGYRKVPTKYIKSLCQALGILEEDFFKPFYQEIDSSEICFDPQLLLQNFLLASAFLENV